MNHTGFSQLVEITPLDECFVFQIYPKESLRHGLLSGPVEMKLKQEFHQK
jgi:hypothetical protein